MTTFTPRSKSRLLTTLELLVLALLMALFIAGIGSILLAYLPYEKLRAFADTLTVDGNADIFTPQIASRIRAKLLVLAPVLLLASGSLFFARQRLYKMMEHLLADAKLASTQFSKDIFASISNKDAPISANAIRLILLLLFTLAIWTRLPYLNREITYDEAFSFLSYASKPTVLGISNYSAPNNHILHTVLMRMSYLAFGLEEWALRLPALISGVLIIPCTFYLGLLFANYRVGLICALATVCSLPLIEYATLARGYSPTILLFVVLTIVSLQLIQQSENILLRTLFITCSALSLAVIPSSVYGVLGLLAWLFCNIADTLLRRITLISILGVGSLLLTSLFYLPALIAVGLDALVANPHVVSQTIDYVLSEGPDSLVWTWEGWHLGIPYRLDYIGAAFALLALAWQARRGPRRYPLLVTLVAIALLGVLLQRVVPYRRMWLYLIPIYNLYIALGIDLAFLKLWSNTRRLGFRELSFVVVALVTTALFAFHSQREFENTFFTEQGTLREAEEISAWLIPRLKPSDRIITAPPSDFPLQYYFEKSKTNRDYFDPIELQAPGEKPSTLYLIENFEPNFTKAGAPWFISRDDVLRSNGYSTVSDYKLSSTKEFAFANVYIYSLQY